VSSANDAIEGLVARVRDAAARRERLVVRGAGSKSFLYAVPDAAAVVPVAAVAGVVDYDPAELVVTARAGTPLAALRAALDAEGQMLGADPPAFAGDGTLGGAVACGLSGPGRPWYGALRDAVLGVEMVNGLGTRLAFGGRVMKNVAGYDLSRLMTGSHGTLGVVLAASLRVVPQPECERTLRFEADGDAARRKTIEWGRRPLPVTATCHVGGILTVRLAGTARGVADACARLGGDAVADADARDFWSSVRDHRHPFFAGRPLWRLSLPPASPDPDLGGAPATWLTEWGGALRWLVSDVDETIVRSAVAARGGHAHLFSRPDGFASVPAAVARYQTRLRAAFDPHGVFARGDAGAVR